MSTTPRRLCSLILVTLTLCANGYAEIYKWVDENGNVHFSDTAPEDGSSEEVEIDVTDAPGAPDEGETRRLDLVRMVEAQERRRAKMARETAATAGSPPSAGRRAEDCYEVRVQRFWLEREAPVYVDESGRYRSMWTHDTYQGERRYISDEDRPAALNEIDRQLLLTCDNPYDASEVAAAEDRWLASEWCATERVKLDALRQKNSRATDDTLEKQEALVRSQCGS